MTDVMFYHLMDNPLQEALTELVEKSRGRGWRVTIQGTFRERLEALNAHFWTYRDETFLAHGIDGDPSPELQPILLTEKQDNENQSNIRFIIDRAEPVNSAQYERVVYMFDGLDPDAVSHARERWKAEKAEGHALTYWQQSQDGRWEKKA